MRYKGLWFWSPKDTIARSEIGSYHPRELYIGDEHDHASVHYNSTDSIIGKCTVRTSSCDSALFHMLQVSHVTPSLSRQVRYFDSPCGEEFDAFIKSPVAFFYRFKYSDERFASGSLSHQRIYSSHSHTHTGAMT